MRKLLFFLIPVGVSIFVFLVFLFVFSGSNDKGALQVTAIPKSSVYLNGKLAGQTPFYKGEGNDMLLAGEYSLRIVPMEGNFVPFEEKIMINKSVLTVVDRTFSEVGLSQGSVITLTPLTDKKKMELSLLSTPDKTEISLDGVVSGVTPLLLTNLTESDHSVRFSKDGYSEKAVHVRTLPGFKLTVTASLGTTMATPTPVASPSAVPEASPSAKVTILTTPLGFLNVRKTPSATGLKIGEVKPGERYVLLDEQPNWFKIELASKSAGWINSSYASKQ